MRKMWFMTMLVVFLLGQVPSVGSVVICTTEDGQIHLAKPDHHNHGHSIDPGEVRDPDSHALPTDTRCVARLSQNSCCRDIAVDYVSPSLVEAKRLGHDAPSPSQSLSKAICSLKQPMHITSLSSHAPNSNLDVLRSVILLI